MHMPLASRLLGWADLQLMVVFAAVGEIALKSESVTSDELVILWCMIGGFFGSFCSLHFYQPKDKFAAGMQFAVNLSFSAIFSPLLVDQVSYWTKIPLGLRLSLPVAFLVGMLACAGVARALPYLQKFIDRYLENQVDVYTSGEHPRLPPKE